MTLDKIAVGEMTIDKMMVNEIIVYEMIGRNDIMSVGQRKLWTFWENLFKIHYIRLLQTIRGKNSRGVAKRE